LPVSSILDHFSGDEPYGLFTKPPFVARAVNRLPTDHALIRLIARGNTEAMHLLYSSLANREAKDRREDG
jgi:hypothetical protein